MSPAFVALMSAVPTSATATEWASGTFTVELIELAATDWTWVVFNRDSDLGSLCGANRDKALIASGGRSRSD